MRDTVGDSADQRGDDATCHSQPALVYCRVSTKGQEQDGTSLDSQEVAGVRHAEELGFRVGRVTREIFSGAELWDRPLLARDRADLKAGRFAALISYSTDRLSRDPIHLSLIAEECERANVALIFVTEPLDDSDEGQLLRFVKGYANKKEREKIRERSLRGKHTRVLSGKVPNMGPELYGYRRDKAAGVRVVHEPEAVVIRRIFVLVVDEKRSYRRIAQMLNAEQVPAPGAARVSAHDPNRRVFWNSSSVMRIIRNPAYKGEGIAWQWRRQARPGHSYALVKRPDDEQVRLPAGVVPAIVSIDIWEQAQAAVHAQLGDRTRNESVPYLLRGVIYCGRCHRKMWPSWRRRAGRNPDVKVRTYRCASYNAHTGPCGAPTVDAEACEAAVWDKVAAVLRNPETIQAEVERRAALGPDATLMADLETARREAMRCENAQARLLQKFASADAGNDFPWELVEREVKRLESEKARWQRTIREVEEHLARRQMKDVQLEQVAAYCARVGANLDRFGFAEKRLALEGLAIQATIRDRTPEISGSIPIDMPDDVESLISPGSPHRWGR